MFPPQLIGDNQFPDYVFSLVPDILDNFGEESDQSDFKLHLTIPP